LFTGFSGYLQSDASSVYNILERGPPGLHEDELQLVGCWAHLRRYFFEAAVCKYAEALEGLRQIREIYRVDGQFRKFDAATRKRLRLEQMAPLFDRFFAWVKQTLTGRQERTKLTQALKYALNQQWELRRVLDDGKLQLDNNRSERALRTIVVGRKNWLFYGSDVHAESAAAIFTILASCRLHRLDPQAYLCDVLRVLPYWPKDRYIELSPLHWRETRARLSEEQLANPVCEIDVPPPLLASAAAA